MLQIHQCGIQNHPAPSEHKLPPLRELLTAIPLPNDFLSCPVPQSTRPAHPEDATLPAYYGTSAQPASIIDHAKSLPISVPLHQADRLHLPGNAVVASKAHVLSSGASPLLPISRVGSVSISDQQTQLLPTPTNSDNAAVGGTNPGARGGNTRKHICKWCFRSFTTLGHLARHNRIHTGERKHQCPWPLCVAKFARQDNCMQHYKTHTNDKKRRRAKQHAPVDAGADTSPGA